MEVEHLASVAGHLDHMSLPLAVQEQHYQHLCTHPKITQNTTFIGSCDF